ncbi:MAG: hypothetical protein ACRDVG_01155 [Jatrophihabitantaceae bacterium]
MGADRPKHAPHAARTPFVLLVLGLIVGGMCALLALNTAAAANEVARHDLAANDQSAAARLVELENEAQASAAPANVAAAARAFGMVPAGNPGFLEVGKDGTVRVLGAAEQASVVPVFVPPAPHKRRHPAAKTSASKSASKSAAKSTSTGPRHHPATSTTSAQPTPTPTPNSTLPGGQR